MNKAEKTVFVGLSGGVDSSVAALRLKREGYRVVGVFIKVWQPDWLECNWEQERLDAMRVAAHLNIPFLTCNAEAAYRDEVAHYFIEEYKAGRTPNPDVMCNQHVKFGAFLNFALERGADYIATGHYAYLRQTSSTQVRGLTSNSTESSRLNLELMRGVDQNKDQTYFLWTLTQEQLARVLLPVGTSTKDVIRNEAAAADIPTADKKDSQGVCFLGHIDIPEFLSHYIDLQDGAVLNTEGEVIGTHRGAFVYTLGQRHGFTLTTTNDTRVAMYVVDTNIEHNTITVANTRPVVHESATLQLHKLNLLQPIEPNTTLQAQFRYRQTPFAVQLSLQENNQASLTILEAKEKPAVGQSCVLYDGAVCVGGGIIGECQST